MKNYRYKSIPLEIGTKIGNYEIIDKVYDEAIKGYKFLVRCLLCSTEKIMQRANLRNASYSYGCRQCFISQCKKNQKDLNQDE